MQFYNPEQAKQFAELWLPAWTGNQPEKLIAFYTDDIFYLDPAMPLGIQGKANLLKYFEKLLAKNPDWIWTHTGSIPLKDGFLNKWKAEFPLKTKTVVCHGVCSVQIRDGLIYRNEVYFDRTPLL